MIRLTRCVELTRAAICAITALTVFAVSAEGLIAADWPQFRGPERNGVSSETGLLDNWAEVAPKELWRQPIGNGFSAISVVAGRMFTAEADDAVRPENREPVGAEFLIRGR